MNRLRNKDDLVHWEFLISRHNATACPNNDIRIDSKSTHDMSDWRTQ